MDVRLADPKWRMPLLELLYAGQLRRRSSISPLLHTLSGLLWVAQEKKVFHLRQEKKEALEALLSRHWPDWRHYGDRCEGDFTEEKLRVLMRARSEHLALSQVLTPGRVYNEKTISALAGGHSKSGSSIPDVEAVSDYAARLRPNRGLALVDAEGHVLDTGSLKSFMCEIHLCERNIRSGLKLGGSMPSVILVSENLAAYMDVDVGDDVAVIYGAGNAYNAVLGAISLFPSEIPVVWFGDLDPEGVLIRQAFIKQCRQPAVPGIPPFWQDYVEGYGRPARKGWQKIDLSEEPAFVLELREKDVWLEQEAVAVDPRFRGWFEREFPIRRQGIQRGEYRKGKENMWDQDSKAANSSLIAEASPFVKDEVCEKPS